MDTLSGQERMGQPDSPARRARLAIRNGQSSGTTHGKANGYAVANLVVIESALAADFLLYCQRNSRACPVLEVTAPGVYEPVLLAPGADLRTDLSLYAIYVDGRREPDRNDVVDLWTPDLVAFLLGSGISFDASLERAGVPTHTNRWVVETTIPTVPAGLFRGPLIATMRWLTPAQAITAVQVSSRFPQFHGAPIHIGDPGEIGANVAAPLLGPPIHGDVPKGLVPVFWACGVTPQRAALEAKVGLLIAHAPGHGFITDLEAERPVDQWAPDEMP
jgi:uncharacterized protein YcsI (UPF0317 family)